MIGTEVNLRLITSADRRMNIEQIKNHHFFYGVDWNTIRQIDAPFVPHLKSMTDTSYFPTDELGEILGLLWPSPSLISRLHRSGTIGSQCGQRFCWREQGHGFFGVSANLLSTTHNTNID